MKIINKKDVLHIDKPEGVKVDYYLRDEYELHYNEQSPNSTQIWHHHEKIFESLFVLQGELTVEWKENNKIKNQIVKAGDLIETEITPHTFTNHTDDITKFLIIKQVLSGENKTRLFKEDKIIDKINN